MLRPSIEIANSPTTIAESAAAFSYRPADNSKESAAAASSQAGREESSSPVCAAGWAY
jgi:hypothetical protein